MKVSLFITRSNAQTNHSKPYMVFVLMIVAAVFLAVNNESMKMYIDSTKLAQAPPLLPCAHQSSSSTKTSSQSLSSEAHRAGRIGGSVAGGLHHHAGRPSRGHHVAGRTAGLHPGEVLGPGRRARQLVPDHRHGAVRHQRDRTTAVRGLRGDGEDGDDHGDRATPEGQHRERP